MLPDRSPSKAKASPSFDQVRKHFKMQPIPHEGGWFSKTYESTQQTPLPQTLKSSFGAHTTRPLGSAILALISTKHFSALHRLKSHEIWHFYFGEPVEVLRLSPDGSSDLSILGPDFLNGQKPQICFPAGTWMGGRPVNDATEAYSLFGCTVTPGFDARDYEGGVRTNLQAHYPDRAELIQRLTRA